MKNYILLDLFCGAGGAGVGYHRAGFEVVGVDINPQRAATEPDAPGGGDSVVYQEFASLRCRQSGKGGPGRYEWDRLSRRPLD